VRASASLSRIPYEYYNITIKFPCSPKNADSLSYEAVEIEQNIKSTGVSKINLNKVKEAQLRELELNLKLNSYWLAYLESTFFYNDDPLRILKQKQLIKKLKEKDFKQTANKYFTNNLIKVVLYPENMK
jgi:zinc protease